ncbi:hypothetical protein LshimejAT787_1601960 [Lyophyllum shimeji]|uniref:Uncharacterized protein n=1 Tax=Lyophyllum shimeji TaxID=47721 RepID=A0A9P3Q020_LYOSH|nr:hypothetical protein LshimejAT787_1601960 [Lyophyllum shimeji]
MGEDEKQAAPAAGAEMQPADDAIDGDDTPPRIAASAETAPRPPSRELTANFSKISVILRNFEDENEDYLAMERALERSILMVGLAVIFSAILESNQINS